MFRSAATRMDLVTADQAATMPALYSTDGQGGDAQARVKLFCASYTWYITEADLATGEAFGLVVNGDTAELGYFDLNELAALNRPAPFVIGVERDLYFTPVALRDLRSAGETIPASSAEFLFRKATA